MLFVLDIITMAAMFIFTAMMLTTGMLMGMMGTLDIRIIIQFTADISKHCFVCISADTAIQLNSCFCQCRLCTAADSAADQDIHTCIGQK